MQVEIKNIAYSLDRIALSKNERSKLNLRLLKMIIFKSLRYFRAFSLSKSKMYLPLFLTITQSCSKVSVDEEIFEDFC